MKRLAIGCAILMAGFTLYFGLGIYVPPQGIPTHEPRVFALVCGLFTLIALHLAFSRTHHYVSNEEGRP